jgi:phosphate-selective porin OprO/OprP
VRPSRQGECFSQARTSARSLAKLTVCLCSFAWLADGATAQDVRPVLSPIGKKEPENSDLPIGRIEAAFGSGPTDLGNATAASSSIPTSAVPSESNELAQLRAQLQKLIEADEKRRADAARRPTFQPAGQVEVDYLWLTQDAANLLTVGDAQDGVDFRRARLTARGEGFDVIEYAIGFDFALSGRPTFLDNFIAVRDLPYLGRVRIGHFFEPFSLERLTLNRYTTFMERSLADTFAPSRNVGIMAYDNWGEFDQGTWAIGWFRSNSDDLGRDFGDLGEWAVTARSTWLPLYDESDGRTYLHLGAAYSFRDPDQGQVRFASRPEARAGAPASSDIPNFVDTGTISALREQRLGAELLWVRGPWSVQAEYMAAAVDPVTGRQRYFQGAYGFVSYFLTGEHRPYNKQSATIDRVLPFENFFRVRTEEGIATGRGAWEVAVRWSWLDLDSVTTRGGTLNDLTLAVNWYLNPYTRLKWEYIRAALDRAPGGFSVAHIFGMRASIDF